MMTVWAVLAALALGAFGGWWMSRPARAVVEGLARRSRILYELAEGDRENVARELEEICAQEPNDTAIFLALAALDRRRGRLERAKSIHRSVLASAELSAEHRVAALVGLGRDLLGQGKEQAAVGALHRASSLSPRSEATLQTLAFALEEAGAWGRAATAWERLEKLSDGRTAQRARIGQGHALAGQAEQAVEALDESKAEKLAERAVALAPESGHTWTVRARIASTSKKAELALQCWEQAWSYAPDMAWALVPEAMEAANGLGELPSMQEAALQLMEQSDHPGLRVALAEALVHHAPQKVQSALEDTGVETAPVHLALLRLRRIQGDEAAIHALLEDDHTRPALSCKRCGLKVHELRFRCPRCGSWDSVSMEGVAPERRVRVTRG